MSKRGSKPKRPRRNAAIYVRTSSEHQGEKASPEAQETECRKLAQEHGLVVSRVYRDIEKYRVKNKLVEPSGSRTDRPGLTQMLQDAQSGLFDTIIAWREDRLYRGMRAMLCVLDAVQEFDLEVLLARETFDQRMAPIKAWVAQMEIDGMKERMAMGVKARLGAGKANCGQDRYGYKRNGEVIEIVEEEAYWVRRIFEWYNDHVPISKIRQRLLDADAPQKGSSIPRKRKWSTTTIQGILKSAKVYATGIKIYHRDGEAFEVQVPKIINLSTYQQFLQVRQANKNHPARNLKRDYLLGGLLVCSCGLKWGAVSVRYYISAKGERKLRKTPTGRYFCHERHPESIHPDCPRTIGSKKADDMVWAKVVEVLNSPDVLLCSAETYINELRHDAAKIHTETQWLQNQLDALALERQNVIAFARKKIISESDLDQQLAALTVQEQAIRAEVSQIQAVIDLALLDNWRSVASQFLQGVRKKLEDLEAAPVTDECKQAIFEAKRHIVLSLVDKVLIKKDKTMEVFFRLDVSALLDQSASEQNQKDGICSHKPQSRPRQTREFCA